MYFIVTKEKDCARKKISINKLFTYEVSIIIICQKRTKLPETLTDLL